MEARRARASEECALSLAEPPTFPERPRRNTTGFDRGNPSRTRNSRRFHPIEAAWGLLGLSCRVHFRSCALRGRGLAPFSASSRLPGHQPSSPKTVPVPLGLVRSVAAETGMHPGSPIGLTSPGLLAKIMEVPRG